MTRLVIVATIFTCSLLCFAGGGSEPAKLSDWVGVWEKCYEPGFAGVSEVDTGFLILEPGGHYREVHQPSDSPVIVETGTFTVAVDGIILTPTKRQRPDGTPGGGHVFKPRSLKLLPGRAVEFWRNRGSLVTTDVLSSTGKLNYGYGRVL